MSALTWDNDGERLYETGVKKCALFVYDSASRTYGIGVAWNGITSISESPSGAEASDLYADDIKYLSLISREELGLSIEAYMYPDEFEQCDGTADLGSIPGVKVGQQSRKMFGLAYETTQGNDVDGNDYGKKLHLIYGCKASPSERSYATINDSPEAITFSWEVNTTGVGNFTVNGVEYKSTSRITIDKVQLDAAKTAGTSALNYDELCEIIYGNSTDEPTLLLPSALYTRLAVTNQTEDGQAEG